MAHVLFTAGEERILTKALTKPAAMISQDLETIITKLERIDLSRFIRRQSAVRFLDTASKAEVVFQEFFVSIADLQKAVWYPG